MPDFGCCFACLESVVFVRSQKCFFVVAVVVVVVAVVVFKKTIIKIKYS